MKPDLFTSIELHLVLVLCTYMSWELLKIYLKKWDYYINFLRHASDYVPYHHHPHPGIECVWPSSWPFPGETQINKEKKEVNESLSYLESNKTLFKKSCLVWFNIIPPPHWSWRGWSGTDLHCPKSSGSSTPCQKEGCGFLQLQRPKSDSRETLKWVRNSKANIGDYNVVNRHILWQSVLPSE